MSKPVSTPPTKKKEETESFQPRKIDFDSMLDFDPNTPLFGSDFKKESKELTDELDESQLTNELDEGQATEEQSTLEDIEREEIERNRNIIASTGRGKKKQAKEGNYMSSLRDPLFEEEKKEKKAKYEAATYDAKVRKAELESIRAENEIDKEKEFREAKRKAELEQLQGSTKKQATTPSLITNPQIAETLINNSKKPDGTIDPINLATMSSLLGGGNQGMDINNLLLMQMLGGNSTKPATTQEPLEFNKLLIMMVLKLFEQMSARPAVPQVQQSHSDLASILPVLTQIQNQATMQQQQLFQTIIGKLQEDKNELREQLMNNNPFEEVKRSVEFAKTLGTLTNSNIPIEAQIQLKQLEHLQQKEIRQLENDQNNQANFAKVLSDLGQKAFESEWIGKALENVGEAIKQKQTMSPQPLPDQYYQDQVVQPTVSRKRKNNTSQQPPEEEPQAPQANEISQTINQYLQSLQQQIDNHQSQQQSEEEEEPQEEEEIIRDNDEENDNGYAPVNESDIVQEATYAKANKSKNELDLRELDNQSLDTMISNSFGKKRQQ